MVQFILIQHPTIFLFHLVAIDCKWSDWTEYTVCSKTCGEGIKEKSRDVIQPALYGGQSCEGPDHQTDTQPCKIRECQCKFK